MSEKRKRGRPSKPGKKTTVRLLTEHYLQLNALAGEDEGLSEPLARILTKAFSASEKSN